MSEPVPEPRVTAVVVTHNRRELLAQTLRAVLAQTLAPARIVVVDNASADGTAEMLLADFPGLDVVTLPENTGGAGGFATGVAEALRSPCDWLWLMDDDVEPDPDALATLLGTREATDPATVALASVKVTPSGAVQREHAGWYDPLRMMPRPSSGSEKEPVEVGYSSFVSLCVRAAAARSIGLPRADFFIWYDDVEYGQRLRLRGAIYLVPRSRVVHHNQDRARRTGTAEVSAAPPWRSYYAFRNRLVMLRESDAGTLAQMGGYVWAAFYGLRRVAKIVLAEPHKRAALGYLARAYADGLRGLTGPRVLPPSPRR